MKFTKKHIIAVLILIIVTTILATNIHATNFANSVNMKNLHDRTSYFVGVVKEVFEHSILVQISEEDRTRIGGNLTFVSTNVYLSDSMTDFMSGDEVIVYFDGMILDSYPMQIMNVYAIFLRSQSKMDIWMDVERVVVMHIQDSHTSGFATSEQKHLDDLFDWFVNLLLTRSAVVEIPNELGTAGVYEFTIYQNNGKYITFKYGEFTAGWFLYIFEEWYQVSNPSIFIFPISPKVEGDERIWQYVDASLLYYFQSQIEYNVVFLRNCYVSTS